SCPLPGPRVSLLEHPCNVCFVSGSPFDICVRRVTEEQAHPGVRRLPQSALVHGRQGAVQFEVSAMHELSDRCLQDETCGIPHGMRDGYWFYLEGTELEGLPGDGGMELHFFS